MSSKKSRKIQDHYRHWWRERSDYYTYDYQLHTTAAKEFIEWKIHGFDIKFPAKVFWKYGQERGAWQYELARRATQETRLPPWPNLTSNEQSFISAELGKSDFPTVSRGRAHVQDGHAPPPLPKGFSDFIDVSWNLNLTDSVLQADFLRRIQEQRVKHGIKSPRGRQGRTTRPPSWLWVEVLDEPSGLNEAKRSALAKARRAAQSALNDLKDKAANAHPHAGRIASLLVAE